MLVADQLSAPVIRGKPWNLPSAMLADSARQIVGHSNVEHAIKLICDDVDVEVIIPRHRK